MNEPVRVLSCFVPAGSCTTIFHGQISLIIYGNGGEGSQLQRENEYKTTECDPRIGESLVTFARLLLVGRGLTFQTESFLFA